MASLSMPETTTINTNNNEENNVDDNNNNNDNGNNRLNQNQDAIKYFTKTHSTRRIKIRTISSNTSRTRNTLFPSFIIYYVPF